MNDINKAIALLKEKGATCVSLNGDDTYISYKRGIATILDEIDGNPQFFNGAVVADKIVGKSAAMLFEKYGVKQLHALTASRHAITYLTGKSIEFTFDNTVEYIINRDGTDMCPMEKSVLNTDDPDEGEKKIRGTLENLRRRK